MSDRTNTHHTLIKQNWREFERGWGSRPDGYTLHLDEAGRERFVDEFLRKQDQRAGGHVPDEYSRPWGDATIVEVSKGLHDQVRAEIEGGVTYWRTRDLEIYEQEIRS